MPDVVCPTCRRGRLEFRRVNRWGEPVAVAGYIVLAASGLALLVGVALVLMADANHAKLLTAESVALIAGSLPAVAAGVFLAARRSVLWCDQCRAVTPAE
jgi:hypothetical protein